MGSLTGAAVIEPGADDKSVTVSGLPGVVGALDLLMNDAASASYLAWIGRSLGSQRLMVSVGRWISEQRAAVTSTVSGRR